MLKETAVVLVCIALGTYLPLSWLAVLLAGGLAVGAAIWLLGLVHQRARHEQLERERAAARRVFVRDYMAKRNVQ